MSSIAILDYGAGNLHSLYKKLKQFTGEVFVTSKLDAINRIDKIILPGVGHFGTAMKNIHSLALSEPLNEFALVLKKPVLGICLGMQIMADKSDEDNGVKGMGWINSSVKKFNMENTLAFKVPHMGWNTISIEKESPVMQGIGSADEFYFVHSYHFCDVPEKEVLNKTDYSYSFVSAVQRENIFGVQYHPEKSHDAGRRILENFVKL